MSSPDFGSGHVPGLLPRPDPQDTAAPCIPAQSGMGPIIPPKLYQRSCCPPPWPEPLTAAAEDGPGIVAARQADRELFDEQLINRLVYDSLQPAAPSAGRSDCADSTGSSCRTTTSSKSLHVGACAGAGNIEAAGHAEEQLPAPQPEAHVYAPSLAPWYTPEGPSDTTLVFESRFESGNLRRAIQVKLTVGQLPYDCFGKAAVPWDRMLSSSHQTAAVVVCETQTHRRLCSLAAG